MKKIKAVLFDLDGTLSHHSPSGADVFANYVRSLGFKISDEDKIRSEHWTHFYFAHSLEIQKDEKNSVGDERAFWLNFVKRRLVSLGIPSATALQIAPKVAAYMDEIHRADAFVPDDAFLLLDALKTAGYILGIASNRGQPYWDNLKELKLHEYFSFAFAGGEINSFKPDRAFFERMLELAGSAPAETIYIGDNYFGDVVGAQRVGITPVLYDPTSLFQDVDCAVIKSFSEFPSLLK
jgi:FMN phosphatase YigB (HAD superfamily)